VLALADERIFMSALETLFMTMRKMRNVPLARSKTRRNSTSRFFERLRTLRRAE
jgi:hypothetical protein